MSKPRLTSPDRSLRHQRDRARRLARRRAHLHEAVAFAYMQGWHLEIRPTITWDAIPAFARGPDSVGHLPDKERNARLCRELGRIMRRKGFPHACLWARSISPHHGAHIHMALHWPLPVEMLVAVLARMTGAPCVTPIRPTHKVIARGAYGAWQINRNTGRDLVKSALRWVNYLETQTYKHRPSTGLEGFELGFSETLGFKAIAAHRPSLQEYRTAHGWPAPIA